MWGRRKLIQAFSHKISREQTAYENLAQYQKGFDIQRNVHRDIFL